MRALLRRHNLIEGDGAVLRFEDLSLNPQTREVHRGPRSVELTKIEFDLLELFFTSPTTGAHPRSDPDLVWGYNFDSGTNSLAVYIGYLRRKLEEANEVRLIRRCAAWVTRFAPRDLSLARHHRDGRCRGPSLSSSLFRLLLDDAQFVDSLR